jgi:hypothetical protein
MKKLALIIPCLLFVASSIAQESNESSTKSVVHHQQLKFGTSLQYEWGEFWGGRDYYYDDYYYDYNYINYNRAVVLESYDGPNTQVFVAYEHIWAYANSIAIAIEPKLGFSFREYQSNGFIGSNWKVYWVNKEIWRSGLYLYTGYEFAQKTRSVYISQENGMYSQRIDRKLNQHVFSSELGLIPFQFTLKSVPVVIELNLAIIGLHVYKVRSSEFENSQGQTERLKYSEVRGYGPKIEFKIGWQIK